MGIKSNFIEMIKGGYPDFDSQNDSVEIEFEGGGDSFGSFSYISIWPNREGELNLSDHWDTLFDVIDNSGVAYNWNNGGTTGRIEYNLDGRQELTVSTIISEEYWGEVEDDEEVGEETFKSE